MEAPPGFEPGIRVLQTRALPLGYSANFNIKIVEQVVGIEPTTKPWQGFILPLNYTCKNNFIKAYIFYQIINSSSRESYNIY